MAYIQPPLGWPPLDPPFGKKRLVQYKVEFDRDEDIEHREEKIELKNELELNKFELQKCIVGIEDAETLSNITDIEGNTLHFGEVNKSVMGMVRYETITTGTVKISVEHIDKHAADQWENISQSVEKSECDMHEICQAFLNEFSSHFVQGEYEVGGIFETLVICDSSVHRRSFKEMCEKLFNALDSDFLKESYTVSEKGVWYTLQEVFNAATYTDYDTNVVSTFKIRFSKHGGLPNESENYDQWMKSIHEDPVTRYGCVPLAQKGQHSIIPVWSLMQSGQDTANHTEVVKDCWLQQKQQFSSPFPYLHTERYLHGEYLHTMPYKVKTKMAHSLNPIQTKKYPRNIHGGYMSMTKSQQNHDYETMKPYQGGYQFKVSRQQHSNTERRSENPPPLPPFKHPHVYDNIQVHGDPFSTIQKKEETPLLARSSYTIRRAQHIYEDVSDSKPLGGQQHSKKNASVKQEMVFVTYPNKRTQSNSQKKADAEKLLQQQFKKLSEKLGLSFHRKKITLQDVMKIKYASSVSKTQGMDQLVWPFLEKVIMMNHRARDNELQYFSKRYESVRKSTESDLRTALRAESENMERFHPLDVFLAIFSKCDPMLQQLIITKMVMCRQAVPFLGWSDQGKLVCFQWTLQRVCIEWRNKEGIACGDSLLKHPMNIISFLRIGKCDISKSILLNEILDSTGHHIFCNRESPNGWIAKSVSLGLIEISHFLPSGKWSDSFDEELLFLNLRGDLQDFFLQREVILNMSTVIVTLVDVEDLDTEQKDLIQHVVKSPESIILVLTCKHLQQRTDQFQQRIDNGIEFSEKLKSENEDSLSIVLAFTRSRTKTTTELKEELLSLIKQRHKNNKKKSLENHILEFPEQITVDQMSMKSCSEGKKFAADTLNIQACMKDLAKYKKEMLPLQGEDWHKWGELKKQKYRMIKTRQNQNKYENLNKEMKNLRTNQQKHCQNISPLMENFIKILNKTLQRNPDTVIIFIQWLKINLDCLSRMYLPSLQREYQDEYDSLSQIRNEGPTKLKQTQDKLYSIEQKIAGAAFGFEHIMREMGQIYEACKEITGRLPKLKHVWKKLPEMAAKLLIHGIPFELMDGDSASVPLEWVRSVLQCLEKEIGPKKRVFILSVIGIQSSGKSTLLNTMFGLEFAVSAGRCTRGVYAQLLAIDTKASQPFPFDYILVLDSEGLRAPELQSTKYQHDNELATFVIGLADLSLVNLKGENTAEMGDVLQIAVHAFLRMKRADKHKHQRCIFVHQNVSALNAKEQNVHGLKELQDNLDKMTREAARAHDPSSDIHSFGQVIEFRGQDDVYYMSDLYSGDPPMAPINPGYSERALDVRSSLLNRFIGEKIQVLTLSDFIIRIEDLWRAILADDFVFSFRNSIAIKAHLSLEKEFLQLKFEIENDILECKLEKGSLLTKCTNFEELKDRTSDAMQDIKVKVQASLAKKQNKLNKFFENTEYQDILNDWHEDKKATLGMFASNIQSIAIEEIQNLRDFRYNLLMHTHKTKDHEKAFMEAATKLASNLKGTKATDAEKEEEFNNMWTKLIDQEDPQLSMRQKMEARVLRKLAASISINHNTIVPILRTKWNQLEQLSINARDIDKKDFVWETSSFVKNLVNKVATAVITPHASTVSKCVNDIFNFLNASYKKLCSSMQAEYLYMYEKFVSEVNETFQKHVAEPNTQWNFRITENGRAHFVAVAASMAIQYYENKYSDKTSQEYQNYYAARIVVDMKGIVITEFGQLGMGKYFVGFEYDLDGNNYLELLDHPQFHYVQCMEDSVETEDLHREHVRLNKPCIHNIMRGVENKLEQLCSSDSKFTKSHGTIFVNYLREECGKHNENCEIKLSNDYIAHFVVLAVKYSVTRFASMDIQFDSKHSTAAYFDKYKAKIKQYFFNQVMESETAITAADLFCGKIMEEVRDHVTNQLLIDIQSKIMRDIGFTKHELMVRVMKDLTENENFDGFMLYVKDAFSYATKWIKTYTDTTIFSKGAFGKSEYAIMAQGHIDNMIDKVTKTIRSTSASTNLEAWICQFCEKDDIFTEADFRQVSSFEISDVKKFVEYSIECLQDRGNLLTHFDAINENTVDWKKQNPYADIIKRLWGCKKQCPYCNEPCKESEENHKGKQHTCLQHRVNGASGWRLDESKVLRLNICPVSITSNRTFVCSSRSCTCGEGAKSKEAVLHPYREYHKYQPDWDIPPDDGAEMSKFWKWFITKYIDQVVEHYGALKPKIPATWKGISKKKAIESLNEYLG